MRMESSLSYKVFLALIVVVALVLLVITLVTANRLVGALTLAMVIGMWPITLSRTLWVLFAQVLLQTAIIFAGYYSMRGSLTDMAAILLGILAASVSYVVIVIISSVIQKQEGRNVSYRKDN